jgi:transposase, IS5 family
MHKFHERTDRTLTVTTESALYDTLIPKDHAFRRLTEIIDWDTLLAPYVAYYSHTGTSSIDVTCGIRALIIQFWDDYSDRQMEQALQENIAVRWFCGWGIEERTPRHSYFGKLRKRLGTKRIADLFKAVNEEMERHGLVGNVFTFIDASTIITKTALWIERDRAIRNGEEKLNNANVERYAVDTDARWGAKSKHKIWFGHKRHCAVDMRHGIITRVAVTDASVPDQKAMHRVLPKHGAVFADKIYDTKKTNALATGRGLYVATVRKNNNPAKNRDVDRFHSKLRMPFESTFSKMNHWARYRGHAKVTLQAFMQALVHNLKKAVTILGPSLATP